MLREEFCVILSFKYYLCFKYYQLSVLFYLFRESIAANTALKQSCGETVVLATPLPATEQLQGCSSAGHLEEMPKAK